MEKMMRLRSLFRSMSLRSYHAFSSTNHILRSTSLLSPSPNPFPSPSSSECRSPFSMGLGSMRFFSEDVTHLPNIKDPELYNVFKDLLAVNWSELPDSVVSNVKNVLSRNTDDKAGKEVVENVFRAAQAVEEFGGILVSLKLELDDSIGVSGEDVKPLPTHIKSALNLIFDRYSTYLNSFGPDESYLRKKVEVELGSSMIHLKMRCSGLAADWGKVTVLGTSGLAGSYVEQRA
ncbi:succinate dehydrogenase subunit 5, mitochondrial [Vigna umbellata]|uniref:succinate dehydrogenase subunit 5, mitochondrial n=1 Tax=Vigna umbellata TaxID=87088 RepID=UPI001F5F9939|nr:succinate dehydrogenase subunit 5, mitochondrial [Vigna umbellata]